MLHLDNDYTRSHILDGNFGLEKENLRVFETGQFATTPHPFPEDDGHIVKDFCENQVEINTSVHGTINDAVAELAHHTKRINDTLRDLEPREYLWPFSNPPFIEKEGEIPVGNPESNLKPEPGINETYREYLAEKYGRYKLTLSGIHVNFSFSDDLLRSEFEQQKAAPDGIADFRLYKDHVYLDLAQKLAQFGWILSAVTAASPLADSSFVEKGVFGIDHIELRMFDLNPLKEEGVEEQDVRFAHLLMVWLASLPERTLSAKDQVEAVQNFKNAAHYDLKTIRISAPDGGNYNAVEAGIKIIEAMKEFYRELDLPVQDVLDFEYQKFVDGNNRYAWQIRQRFQDGYVRKGMQLARERQGG